MQRPPRGATPGPRQPDQQTGVANGARPGDALDAAANLGPRSPRQSESRIAGMLAGFRAFMNTEALAGERRTKLRETLKTDLGKIAEHAPDILKPDEIDGILETPELFTTGSLTFRDHLFTYGSNAVSATGGLLLGIGLASEKPALAAVGAVGIALGQLGARATEMEIAKGRDAQMSELALIFALRAIGDKAETAEELRAARRERRQLDTTARMVIRFQAMVGALNGLEARLNAIQMFGNVMLGMAATRGPLGLGGASRDQLNEAAASFRAQIQEAREAITKAVGPDGVIDLGNGFLQLLAPESPFNGQQPPTPTTQP